MPELPEVETACRTMRSVLVGHKIVEAEVAPDSIVLGGAPPEAVTSALEGRTVTAIGRKGKFWWIEFAESPWVFGHLGMAGWIREMGAHTIRLREHGEAPMDDENGRPRFLKLRLKSDNGRQVVFTDGRRLGRIWLAPNAETDPRVKTLGPDAWQAMPTVEELKKQLGKRKAPIKALLMDQNWISGIGNWLADEILYHARIAPGREASSLSEAEIKLMRAKTLEILERAVNDGADATKYPQDWLFHVRWGGSKGNDTHQGYRLVRETVGGRTTAWLPELQK
ncbi:MAG: hypothetical protein JSS72_12465 [Armatimonadetes bacterium]|nr:hypothetical protein [Armatimonadota bacterium]